MKAALCEDVLARLSEFIDSRMALHFPKARWGDLERVTLSTAKKFDPGNPEAFIERLLSGTLPAGQLRSLANRLTIGETFFWREPQVMEALEKRIVPELIQSREGKGKRLRIWSAGCSTGEECYSIAIALRRAVPDPDDWDISILATDINTEGLRKASEGSYGEWSLRNVPPWLIETYFHRESDGTFSIAPEVRRMVHFAYLNLAEDVYPSPMNETNDVDIIFCRNVLMYFSAERARRIVRNIHRSLVDKGWLMVGASELSQSLFRGFACVRFHDAFVYRKLDEIPRSITEPGDTETCIAANPTKSHGRDSVPHPRASAAGASADIRQSRGTTASSVRTLADRGRLPEALALCKEAIARDKLGAEIRYLEATILMESGREEEAIASLERTLFLDPRHILAYFTLGTLALRRGDAATSSRCLKNALDLLAMSGDEDTVPGSEGLAVGRFREIIRATMRPRASA
jgi:chemotaxis protein methyltransferase CheR